MLRLKAAIFYRDFHSSGSMFGPLSTLMQVSITVMVGSVQILGLGTIFDNSFGEIREEN